MEYLKQIEDVAGVAKLNSSSLAVLASSMALKIEA